MESGSTCPLVQISAILVFAPKEVTVTVIVNVALMPTLRFPILQMPVVSSYAPRVAIEDWYAMPAGNTSFTETPVASFVPLFRIVNIKSIFVPVVGVGSLTLCKS